jgi:NADH-quinone oxidoreductase subunit D
MSEMRASLDIVAQVIGKLKSGAVNCFAPGQWPARLPPGAAYASVEGARGELGMYLISDGSDRLLRSHVRGPSLANLSLLPLIARTARIDQVAMILNSLDVSIAEVER